MEIIFPKKRKVPRLFPLEPLEKNRQIEDCSNTRKKFQVLTFFDHCYFELKTELFPKKKKFPMVLLYYSIVLISLSISLPHYKYSIF